MGTRTKAALKTLAALILIVVLAGGATFYFNPLWVNDQIIRAKLWQQHVESKYVVVEGYSIHYFEAHPPKLPNQPNNEGVPLVLIHGIGSRGEDWSPLIPTLAAQGFHVYVPDLLGFGRSPKPDVDYAISLQEDIVLKFMDTLQLEHADVAGWSMGGWIAIRLTLDHPDMVDRLVVFDSAGIYFPPTFDASLFIPTDAAGLTLLGHTLSPLKKPPLPPFVVRAALDVLRRNGWIIERSFNAMENGKDLTDFRLYNIRKPTLVVWGSVDQLIPLPVGEQLHHAIPASSMVVVTGCGHLAPAECPRPVLKATVEFLKADPPPQPAKTTVDGTKNATFK